MGPLEVSVLTLQPQTLALNTELPGRIAANLTAEIRPQVNGIVKARLFEEGAMVHQGQILYKIDPAPYQASLAQARANLSMAEANLPSLEAKVNRYHDLVAIHAVGQQDYDDALSALQQARATVAADKAALSSAQINLSYTPVRSPITGRIGKSSVTVGGLVSSYQTTVLATVQKIDPVYVDVVQSNADLLRLRARLESGQINADKAQASKVKLYLEDGSTYPVEGKLQFRDVTVDATTGSVTLRMSFTNPKQVLLPGMYVRARVEEGVKKGAILAPQQAVLRDPKGNPYSWVVGKDGHIVRRALVIDRALGNQWLISDGLMAGDQLVMEGTDRVKEGMPVRTTVFKDTTPSQPATAGSR
jgi:membrane fusion protein (multidrug efflux system)